MSANLAGTTKQQGATPVADNTVGVIPLSERKALRIHIDGSDADALMVQTLIGIQDSLSNGPKAEDNFNGAAGSVGVFKVEQRYNYTRISTATTTLIKTGAGMLHAIITNTRVANGIIEADDALTNAAPIIAKITYPAALLSDGPQATTYDVQFTTGLSITTTGTMDITVAWR